MEDEQIPDDRNKKTNKDIAEENELLKLKLSAQYGAQFDDPSSGLPMEVENEWLHYIQAFEEASQNPTYIKVQEKLGNPAFPAAETLEDHEVESELNNLMELLGLHDIALDILGEYEDRVIYQFITEELFEFEMEVIDVPGMVTNYIYEDFHPNPLLDARDALVEMLNGLAEEHEEEKVHFYTWRFHEDGITNRNGNWLDSDEIDKRYKALQLTISSLQIEKISEEEVEWVTKDEAVYTAHIRYRYKMNSETGWQEFDTSCRLTMKPSSLSPMWGVARMDCAGFNL